MPDPAPLSPLGAALVGARRTARRAPADDASTPADRRSAYAVQAEVSHALGAKVTGWKVGMLADGTPMAAPMFADDVRESGARWKLPGDRLLVAEVELAVRLTRDLPARPSHPYRRDEVADAIGEIIVGVEVLTSRVDVPRFPPFLQHLADNLGNAGYVTGGASRDVRGRDLARLRCRVWIDGKQVHDAVGGHPQDDPWRPLMACLDEGLTPLGGFRAGQIVTTGSLIPPIDVARPARLTASLEGVGDVEVVFQ